MNIQVQKIEDNRLPDEAIAKALAGADASTQAVILVGCCLAACEYDYREQFKGIAKNLEPVHAKRVAAMLRKLSTAIDAAKGGS
jgi:hypothetical protein